MKKIIFLLLFVVVSFQGAFSQTFAYNGRNYEVTSTTTVRVGSNGGATGTVSIPAQVTYNSNTYTVTEIKTSAFIGSSGLTSVILPNSITIIGENSFYNCPFLTSITLSTSLTSISRNAFSECIRLSSITIPSSVTSIGDYAFNNCTSLTSLIIPNSVTSTGISAFNNCSGLTSVIIPNSLTLIKDNSFSGCTSLTSVTIPNSVTSIGFAAFDTCISLTSLTIGNSVTSIGAAAFNNCRNLTSIICNVATPLSAGSVFGGNNPLIRSNCSLKVPASSLAAYQVATIWKNFNPISCITTSNTTTISACGNYTWANNNQTYSASGTYTGLTTNCVTEMLNLTITPSTTNTTTISACNSYTWANNGQSYSASGSHTGTTTNCITEVLNLIITTQPTNFTSGGINYVVTSENTVAVGGNGNANGNIIIPATITTSCGTYSVTSINEYAFSNNTALTTITIPDSVISISDFAFYGCSNLTSITFGNSLASIGLRVFEGSSSLTSITFPNSVSSIGNRAFANCTGLTSVTFGNSITNIGSEAFFGCSFLTSVTIPNSLTSISYGTFFNCIGLTSVIIGNSVTSIGESAFNNCNSLTSVTIPNSVTSIGAYSFLSCTSLTSLNLGNLVTTIGDFAFDNCSALTSVTIPNSVTSIGGRAFSGCTSLTSLTIGNSVSIIGSRAFGFSNSLTSVRCDIIIPLSINSEVFLGLNQSACSLTVPNGSIEVYQAAAVWQNFSPINCSNITENTTTISACGSYTWANNNQTYTTSGTYTGNTINCVTEILNLTINAIPTVVNQSALLDQQSGVYTGSSGTLNQYQTFTAGLSGKLEKISINLGNPNGNQSATTLTVQVYNGEGTSGTLLGTQTYTYPAQTGFQYIDFNFSGISVVEGQQYTFKLITPSLTFAFIGTSYDSYSGGYLNFSTSADISFKTYVGNLNQTFCQGATVANLTAFGTNVKWYKNATGGLQLASSELLETGSYYVSQSITSCESERALVNVTITANTNNTTTISVCDSYTWANNGQTYTASGTYTSTTTNCITEILNLTITPSSTNTTTISACNSYTWANNSQTYYTSGTYIGTTTNCVKEVLNLTITTQPANFTSGGINYVVTTPTTVAVGLNPSASGNIIIPASVTTSCGTFTVTSIIATAFQSCSGLTQVTIPESITMLGSFAFRNCSNLTSVVIPNSVNTINQGVFQGCTGLTSATISNSLTSIGNQLFYNCSGLTSVIIPSSVTTIGNGAFFNCIGLTSVIIPSSVTTIGNGAFRGCNNLTSVTIPSSVANMGIDVFYDCTNLTSVICNIPTPLVINANVFQNVNQSACSLTVANVSAYQAAAVWQNFAPINCSIITTNTTTISACNSYTWANNGQNYSASGTYSGTTTNCVTEVLNLTITTQPTNFTSGGINYVVTSPTTVAVGGNGGASGSIVIPATVTTDCGTYSVTSISDLAFRSCSSLTSVVIPNSVISIGFDAFAYCSGLTTLNIPNSVTSIGTVAFGYCTSLTSINIPNSINRLNNGLFRGCNLLTTLNIPSSVNIIGYEVFRDCTGLTSLICNNTNPVSVNETTFGGVNQGTCNLIVPNASAAAAYRIAPFWKYFAPITCLNITENSTTISACNSYTWTHNNQTYTTSGTYTGTTTNCVTEILNLTITTPPTTFISGGIKYVLTSPTTVSVGLNPTASGSIIIPATVTTDCGTYSVTGIGHSAFYSCSGLTSITIPNTVSFIDMYAFEGCTSLTSVTIPNSVTTINDFAFLACNSLTSITIPNSLNRINKAVFKECSSLTTVIIPNSVTSIGESAFQFCSGLTTVTIPSSVTSIGINAFNNCTSLTSVISNKVTPLLINANVFGGVNQPACSLTVPDASVAAYQAAAVWQNFAPIYCANQTVNTTTISVCDNYTWANNGQTYSVSGTYRGSTSNCITEMLNLTITPSTTNSTTISACDSYNWSVNGQNYTSGGTYNSVSGCHTDTLVLTITPSSDTTTEITSCGSYTWANNGLTYFASGIYRGRTTNCVTAVLNLTINALPSAPSLSLVDQHCDNITGYLGLKNQTQTFKAGASGRLDKISMYLGNPNGDVSASTLTVQVYEGSGTNGTLLGSKEYAYPAQWGFQNIDFNFTDISVVQNQQYTFKLSTPSVSQGFVGINTENTYSNGSLDFAPSSDMIFKTYVVRANQTFCQGATVSNLESDGSNIIWYDAATGGNQINSNELLATGTYFVAQNDDNSCQSQRTSVNVLVNPTTAITLQPVAGLICSAVGSTTTFSVASNAVNTSYTWQYKVAATTANANPDWISITSANAAVYSNFDTPTLTVTKTSQLPSTGTQYRVLVSGTCGNATSNVVPLSILSTVKAGSISTSASSVCIGSDITLTVAGYAGTSFQWQSSPISTSTATGDFTDIEGATGTTLTVAGVTITSDKSYRVMVTNSCNNTSATSATKTIVVNPTSVAGTVTGGGIVCSGGSGALKIAGHTGSIQWEYSTNGIDYINAPKAADAQTVPFGTTSSNSTATTYIVTNITANTYFRAKITSGACSSAYTTPVQYTITTVVVGNISADSSSLCTGTGTSLTLTNATGAVTWQKSTNLTTPSWSAIANATGLSIETGNLTVSTAFRAMVTLGGCDAINSNVVNVSVVAAPFAKTISANATTPAGTLTSKAICTNSTVAKTLTVGSGYVGAIQWQKSTTSTTTEFVDIAGQIESSYTVTNPSDGANYFRAKFTNSCGASVYGTAYTLYYKNCVTTTSRIIEKSDKEIAEFKVIASPNPYSENFNLNITTSRAENVEVSIYDMTGKLIDKHEVRPNDATTLEFGTNYPTGVYNVMVTQGIETKTLRVIKK